MATPRSKMTRPSGQMPMEAYIRGAINNNKTTGVERREGEAQEGLSRRRIGQETGKNDGKQGKGARKVECAAGKYCKGRGRAAAAVRCIACGEPAHRECRAWIKPEEGLATPRGFPVVCKQCIAKEGINVQEEKTGQQYVGSSEEAIRRALSKKWGKMKNAKGNNEGTAKDDGEKQGEESEKATRAQEPTANDKGEGAEAETRDKTGEKKMDEEGADDSSEDENEWDDEWEETTKGGGDDAQQEKGGAEGGNKKRTTRSPRHAMQEEQPHKRTDLRRMGGEKEDEAAKQDDDEENKEQEGPKENAIGSRGDKTQQEKEPELHKPEESMDCDEATQAGSNESGLNWRGTGRDEAVETRYCDVQMMIEGGDGANDAGTAIDAAIASCKEFLRSIQRVNATAKLIPWNPYEDQTIVHAMESFPTDMTNLKKFFKGVRPIYKAAREKGYLKVKIEAKGQISKITTELTDYFQHVGGRFEVAKIQAPSTTTLGWLLYSTRQIDADALEEELTKLAKTQVAITWKRISDGEKYDPNRDTKKDPRALHVESSTEDRALVAKVLEVYYSTQAKKFPLGVRMRIITPLSGIVNTDMRKGWFELRERQMEWCLNVVAMTTYDIIPECLQEIPEGSHLTLREMIMRTKSTSGNIRTPLFTSVDKQWRGNGYVLQFHPDKTAEARMVVKGLLVKLTADYGSDVERVFTSMARVESRTMRWDEESKRVISEKDKEVEAAMTIDEDMHFVTDKTQEESSDEEEERFESNVRKEKDYGEEDTIPSMRDKKAWRKIKETKTAQRKKAQKKKEEEASVASSITEGSRLTTGTQREKVAMLQEQMGKILEARAQGSVTSTLSGSTGRTTGTTRAMMASMQRQMEEMQRMLISTNEENARLRSERQDVQERTDVRPPTVQCDTPAIRMGDNQDEVHDNEGNGEPQGDPEKG